MNTVNVVMTIGIVIVGFLIRREVKHGELLDEMLRIDKIKAAEGKQHKPELSDLDRAE
ncbi:hypothetical protein AEP_02649 [Curvibacter sp. AEP1-3]|uniref:hypothetical protein n=1 Tax=Curvibacter sp. AEP1-3 TaxID=1844971 RepID=UPI000B556BC7|nr:hypothetical protein [Curvibacter sp. AEP1-3]ARV19575.1 hypothetical protein AEP_02649 [Curvibacter sp. AEP1-3]